jgi:hypothetical protein
MNHFYVSKEFARLARRSGLTDNGLKEAVNRAENGKIDADLGGGLIKQRIAYGSRGRSSGFRTIIAYRQGERAVFLHVFAKARQANLSEAELEMYRELAKVIGRLSESELDELVNKRGWRRIERANGEEGKVP